MKDNNEGFSLNDLGQEASHMAGKGEDFAKQKAEEVENLAKQGTDEAKKKLVQIAKDHGVKDVDENMQIGEIKNKIKAAWRNNG
ncbi:MAG: hypothetical protein M1383_03305 [Patescibacteria group bacterium]|nr:hypothetical protein [Patescibacteria group bacterium]